MEFQDEPVVKLLKLCNFDYEKAQKESGISVVDLKRRVVVLSGKYDARLFAEHLKIRTKDGKLKPLKFNKGQLKLEAAVKKCIDAGKPVRIKNLKARQYGGSTWTQSRMARSVRYDQHKQLLTVCHDLDSARNMRSMFERFEKSYPYGFPQHKKMAGSEKWWRFSETDTDYLIDTADELDTGRSFTIHRLHASEIAFYRDPETLMMGLLQAVPDDPDTFVMVESTGNGIGDYFYNFIHANNGYELVFVGWHEIEDYTKSFDNDSDKLALERMLSPYEKSLMDMGCSLEQLHWRRFTIESKLNGDEDKFKQEYPASPEEAFIASGRPYFPIGLVHEQLLKTEKATPKVGFLEDFEDGVRFSEDPSGEWTIFEEPEEGFVNRYVSGTDTAEGKDVSESSPDPDFSIVRIFDRKTGKNVAKLRTRRDVDLIAEEVRKAHAYYGTACDAVERNASGLVVIGRLKDVEGLNLYRKIDLGKVEEKETAEYGFRTTEQTREVLLSELRSWIRQGKYKSDDHEFWSECSTFVFDKNGKPQGQKGRHDDEVICAGLEIQAAIQANELYPIEVTEAARRPLADEDVWKKDEQEELIHAEF